MEEKIRISPIEEISEKTYKCADGELEIFSFLLIWYNLNMSSIPISNKLRIFSGIST